jgi:hypothetical protein
VALTSCCPLPTIPERSDQYREHRHRDAMSGIHPAWRYVGRWRLFWASWMVGTPDERFAPLAAH